MRLFTGRLSTDSQIANRGWFNLVPAEPEGPREENVVIGPSPSSLSASSVVDQRSTLVESVSYVGGLNIVAFAAGLFRQKVFAVFLAPAGLGVFGLVASFFELFTTLTRLGMPAGLLREVRGSLTERDLSKAARVFIDVRRIARLVSIGLGVFAILLAPLLVKYVFVDVVPEWSVQVIAVAAPLFLAGELCASMINALGRIRMLAAANATTVLAGLPVAVWLVATWGLTGAIVQLATGALIAFLVSRGFLLLVFRPGEHNPGRVSRAEADRAVARAFRLGIAQTLHHLAMTANFFVFRSLIVANLGTIANGFYQGAMSFSRQYTIAVSGGLFVYLYPRLAGDSGSRGEFSRELTRGLSFVLTVAVPVTVGVLAMRDWIVRILFTSEFLPVVSLMAYSVPGDIVWIVGEVLRGALLASGASRSYVVVGLLTEGLSFCVFASGLHLFGLRGATGSYVLANLCGVIICGAVLMRRGLLRMSPRLALQVLLAIPVVGLMILTPLGVWTSRGLAVAMAGLWVVSWRRELLSGFRY